MTHEANRVKDFLLEWIILHGDNWVFHKDAYKKDLIFFEMCRIKKYIEEEDQLPEHDKTLWGSYFKITKKGRDYATMR